MKADATGARVSVRSPYQASEVVAGSTSAEARIQDVYEASAPDETSKLDTRLRKAALYTFMLGAGHIASTWRNPTNFSPPVLTSPVGNCFADGQIIQGKCSDQMNKLGAEGQKLYASMPLGLKQWFSQNVNGKAGPFGMVNKRDSFIKGSWGGFNVFDFVNGKLDDKLKNMHKVTPEEIKSGKTMSAADIQRGKEINETCRRMTPDQRRAFVDLLDLDTGRKPL
jgi:hypothetical protein